MSSFDDLQTLWRTADDPAPPVDPERIDALRSEASRFDRAIWWRDWRETAAAVIVAAAFGRMWPYSPPAARVGIVLAVLGAVFVIGWLWRAQRLRPRPAPDLPPADALRAALARVDIQIGLLRSVAWWYLLPLAVGPLVLVYAGYAEMLQDMPVLDTALKVGFMVFLWIAPLLLLGGVFGFVYWLNQRAVRKDLLPLRDRLLHLLRDFPDHD